MARKTAELAVTLGFSADKFNAGISRAMRRMDKFGKKMQRIGGDLTRNLSMPIAAMGVGILKTAGDFQAGMNRVQALSGATGREFTKLTQLAEDLGTTTQFSATEASQAMGFLAMAGADTNEILGMLPGTLDLATASGQDLASTADTMTNIMSGFGIDVSKTGKVTDVLTATFTSSNTSLENLGEAFKMAGPVAATAGVSFNETAAILGLFGNAGIQGSLAGTQLKNAIINLIKPSDAAKKILKDLGVVTKDAEGKLLGMDVIVEQLAPHVEDTAAMVEIFGKRALSGMSTVLRSGAGELRDFTSAVDDANNITKEIAEVQMVGFNGAMLELKSAIEGAAIAIGDAGLLDWAESLADKLTLLFRAMADVSPEALRFATAIAGIGLVVGPFLLVGGTLIKFFGRFGTKLLKFTPQGKIITGIIAGLALVETTFQKGIPGAIDVALDAFSGFKTGLIVVKNTITTWAQDVKDVLKGFGVDTDDFFGKLGRALANWASDGTQYVVDKFKDMGKEIAPYARLAILPYKDAIDAVRVAIIQAKAEQDGWTESAHDFEGVVFKANLGIRDSHHVMTNLATVVEDAKNKTDDLTVSVEDNGRKFFQLNRVIGDTAQTGREAAIAQNDLAETINSANEAAAQAKIDQFDFWRTTEELAVDAARGVHGAWVGLFEDIFTGGNVLDSIKGFLKRVKTMFLQIIAEIAAAWAAAQIFKVLGIQLPGISVGGNILGTAITSGISEAIQNSALGQAVTSTVSGWFSAGATEGILTSGAAGPIVGVSGAVPLAPVGSVGAGVGAPGAAGAGAGVTAGAAAAAAAAALAWVVGGSALIKALKGPTIKQKMLKDLQTAVDVATTTGGTAIFDGERYTFAQSAMAGFFASMSSGIEMVDGQMVGFRDMTAAETTNEIVRMEQQFRHMGEQASRVLTNGATSAQTMGQYMQDGVVDRVEAAQVGFEGLGIPITDAQTGMIDLGNMSTIQFGLINQAIDSGKLRLSALKGETALTAQETNLLQQIGVATYAMIESGAAGAIAVQDGLNDSLAISVNAMGSLGESAIAMGLDLEGAINHAVDIANQDIGFMGMVIRGELESMTDAALAAATAIGGIGSGSVNVPPSNVFNPPNNNGGGDFGGGDSGGNNTKMVLPGLNDGPSAEVLLLREIRDEVRRQNRRGLYKAA